MPSIRFLAVLPWLATVLAQQPASDPPKTPSPPAPPEYHKLVAEYEQARSGAGGFAVTADPATFPRRFRTTADQFAGEQRVPFLTWAALHAGRDQDLLTDALAALRQDHVKSPQLQALLQGFQPLLRQLGAEAAHEFLVAVRKDSPHPVVQAWAIYVESRRVQADRRASAEDKAAAKAALLEAERLAAGTELADILGAANFAERKLQIGMPVPDIDGKDTDGVAFKLSDYRGKVILLDFWGFW